MLTVVTIYALIVTIRLCVIWGRLMDSRNLVLEWQGMYETEKISREQACREAGIYEVDMNKAIAEAKRLKDERDVSDRLMEEMTRQLSEAQKERDDAVKEAARWKETAEYARGCLREVAELIDQHCLDLTAKTETELPF